MQILPTPAQAQDYERMMAMVTGYWVTQTVRAAALYQLADHLAEGTDTPDAIAQAEGTDLGATRRLMRACASLGLMASPDGGTHYSGTSLLSTLSKDDPNSLRGFAISQASPGHWLPWGRFPEAVRTGQHQSKAAHGDEIFDYFAKHLDEAALFTESMGNLSRAAAEDIAAVLDTKGVTLALDLGGANGEVVRAMLKVNPDLHGAVFDLPHIVPDAAAAAEADGLTERFTTVGGDFFEEVPPADLYVLKYIMHDWDDDACVRILKNCRASLKEGGRVVVVDLLIPEVGIPGIAPLMDMNMLSMTGGKERETAEFDALFSAAGLRRTKITPAGAFAVIETVAV
ncbi:methyltransferase [Saccharopolyspora shandongensis]|uniref:methyltransferase n=1 Tax=Saccharopolyspora shandongensis TaxID=418495 RepID=UPI003409B410